MTFEFPVTTEPKVEKEEIEIKIEEPEEEVEEKVEEPKQEEKKKRGFFNFGR